MSNQKVYEQAQTTDALFVFEDNPLLRAGLKMSHLRMLVMIEEHGQVSAAAAAMNMTQPAASRMLGNGSDRQIAALSESIARCGSDEVRRGAGATGAHHIAGAA